MVQPLQGPNQILVQDVKHLQHEQCLPARRLAQRGGPLGHEYVH